MRSEIEIKIFLTEEDLQDLKLYENLSLTINNKKITLLRDS